MQEFHFVPPFARVRNLLLSEKQVIELVQNADGSWQMPDENQDVEPTPDIFDPLDSEK